MKKHTLVIWIVLCSLLLTCTALATGPSCTDPSLPGWIASGYCPFCGSRIGTPIARNDPFLNGPCQCCGYEDPFCNHYDASCFAAYDLGIPYLGGRVYGQDEMNIIIYWVQVQMKATGVYYQGDNWDETGNLGDHTMQEIARFMKARGYAHHSGCVDQDVVCELASFLGDRRVPVYVGGFYDRMDSIMIGGSSGSMESIVSNMRDGVARTNHGALWIQTCLRGLGYYNGALDGKYGQDTEIAVKKFQADHGFMQRDYVSLGVARAMLESYYSAGCNMNCLP